MLSRCLSARREGLDWITTAIVRVSLVRYTPAGSTSRWNPDQEFSCFVRLIEQ